MLKSSSFLSLLILAAVNQCQMVWNASSKLFEIGQKSLLAEMLTRKKGEKCANSRKLDEKFSAAFTLQCTT